MDATELFKKVRKIEIKTRGLTRNIFAGEYHSAFKGRGMAFSEVREYQIGDDIRNLDWNVTARFNHPFIKVFEEERELTVVLIIDVSGSNEFGTRGEFKREQIAKVAAVLAFSAIQNNDKIGVIFFSDKIEKFIPPKKGKSHILRIISEVLSYESTSKKTAIKEALRYLTNAIKKRCTAFLISDFISDNYADALRIARYKHDLMAIKINDDREMELPPVGLIQLTDLETNEKIWVNTSSKRTREQYAKAYRELDKVFTDTMKRSGIDFATIKTGDDFVKPLMKLFKKREKK